MKHMHFFVAAALLLPCTAASVPAVAQTGRTMPPNTMIVVTPVNSITSKKAETGEKYQFQVVNDVMENGVVVIPRGAAVVGTMTWKTGRAIGGKSGKFEITFNTVNVGGHDYAVRGTHRQEGRGNSVGALLGSMVVSGRSAVMDPGQLVNVFTADAIPY